jgi:HPt (histidine-containing phosphotransfer) domain-containing protein
MALIDLEHLRRIVGNDPEVLKQILEIFTRIAPKDIEALTNAAAEGNHDQVSFYSHKLKSAAGAIGYNSAYDDFKELETLAKNLADIDVIQQKVKLMSQDCATCMVDIERIRKEL